MSDKSSSTDKRDTRSREVARACADTLAFVQHNGIPDKQGGYELKGPNIVRQLDRWIGWLVPQWTEHRDVAKTLSEMPWAAGATQGPYTPATLPVTCLDIGRTTLAPNTPEQHAMTFVDIVWRTPHPRAVNCESRYIPAEAVKHLRWGAGLERGTSELATYSPDFTSVDWYGTRYSFTKGIQAECVRALWNAWESGGHSLSQETLKEKAGSGAWHFRLAHVFRTKKTGGGYQAHPAWGTMIQEDSKGSFRLAPPQSP